MVARSVYSSSVSDSLLEVPENRLTISGPKIQQVDRDDERKITASWISTKGNNPAKNMLLQKLRIQFCR